MICTCLGVCQFSDLYTITESLLGAGYPTRGHPGAPAVSSLGAVPARHLRPPSPALWYRPCKTGPAPETQRRDRRGWDTSGSSSPAPWSRPGACATAAKRGDDRGLGGRAALVERQHRRRRKRQREDSRGRWSAGQVSSELTRQCSRGGQSGKTPWCRRFNKLWPCYSRSREEDWNGMVWSNEPALLARLQKVQKRRQGAN